ncbi:hypothetical protein GH714_017478 [Hevea brasiliensis]|uniref:Protein kinase domain-containing protein n=1 Tax=Hevea brasiliensis TaxID=3981 RepID=A0A6A6LBW6_HEVBR|nr:hypothetical protein GH714_017478 [Hevea brasiliensis]
MALEEDSSDNHGVAWRRGPLLGKGVFASVYLAFLTKPKSRRAFYPPLMAVKSAEVSSSSSLQKEKQVFNHLPDCPYILECYGEETTMSKDGKMLYNLLLEYASGGTLADLIKRSGGCGLPESDVKRYTSSILKGTALYMAPETLVDNIQEFPSDIWALGCMVFEMFTGKSLWGSNPDETTEEACERIADRYEMPKIPSWISKDGKDFLKGCLAKNHQFRFTIEMLLIHPFDTNFSSAQLELKKFGHMFERIEDLVSCNCKEYGLNEARMGMFSSVQLWKENHGSGYCKLLSDKDANSASHEVSSQLTCRGCAYEGSRSDGGGMKMQ